MSKFISRAAIIAIMLQAIALETAAAQTSDAPAGDGVETVTVTASRVQRSDFTAPTPTTILTKQDIEKTGATNIGEITAQVPAFQATGTPTTSVLSSDSGRGNFLDLRGLGPSRTLVLVDGQRFVPTTSNGLVDTDVIPAAIISRVEVVTGGASASWGSDAVAGVVNVILDKDLTGLHLNAQLGESQEGDNQEYKVSLAYGTDFANGRGHFLIAGEDVDNYGVLHQSDRSWGAKNWGLVQTPQYANVQVPNAHLSIATNGGLILTGALAGTQFGPGGSLEPFQFGTNVGSLYMQGGDGALFAPNVALEVPLSRDNVFSRASFDVTPDITAFVDASYSRAVTRNPNLTPNFDLVDTLTPDNAFLPTAARDAMIADGEPAFLLGRIDNDFGFIRSNDYNNVARVSTGLDGQFGETWKWNAYYEFGHVNHLNTLDGVINTGNYALSLDSIDAPGTGTPTCRSTLTDPGNGCVPIDIFGVGSPSKAAVDFVTGNEVTHTTTEENVVAGSIQGEPFSDWAGPVSIAAGAEHRTERANSTVDAAQEADDYLIGDGKSFHGSYDVTEGFAETVVPVLADLSFAKSLDVDLAARYTDYSTSGYVTTWKAGATYEITDEISLRAMRSRDIRAPNLSELFQTGSLNFSAVDDPANGNQSAFIANPEPPNPNLKPEKADTITAGAIYQPNWLTGLQLSADFYNIKINQVISQLTPQAVVNGCFGGNLALCTLVHRDNTNTITEVDTPFINLSSFETRGFDLEASYPLELDSLRDSWAGTITFRGLANYVDLFETSDGTTRVNEAGAVGAVNLPSNIGSTEGVPHWRANINATYENGPLQVYLAGRYVGGGKLDNLYGPTDVPNNHADGRFYVDTSVSYTIYHSDGTNVKLYGLVDNLFNVDPPIIVSNFIAPPATNPQLYDVIGRTFAIGVRVDD